MFFVEPKVLEYSSRTNVNFLYQKDKIYVMDNHLCASWCWAKHINLKNQYNFVHIDRHYDMNFYDKEFQEEIIDKNIDISKLSFDEYYKIQDPLSKSHSFFSPLFCFDNFILGFDKLYPNVLNNNIFITKKLGCVEKKGFITEEKEIDKFIEEFVWWFDSNNNKIILDIDLDFFFSEYPQVKMYTDEFINKVIDIILKTWDKIEVITIALSPEYCIDWTNSINVFEIFNQRLNLELDLKKYQNKLT